jgi:hypothetical protein
MNSTLFNPYPGKEGPMGPIDFISSYNMRTNYFSAVNFYDFVHAKNGTRKILIKTKLCLNVYGKFKLFLP